MAPAPRSSTEHAAAHDEPFVSRSIALAVVWFLSLAPSVWLRAESLELSSLALAALPWIAGLGLPRIARVEGARDAAGAWRRALGATLLALPPIALGASFDRARGGLVRELVFEGLAIVISVLALAWAAERAAGDERAHRRHAIAWFALVPLGPALAGALELGGAPLYGAAPAALTALGRASPLGACLRRVIEAPEGRGAGELALELGPRLAVLACVSIAAAVGTRTARGDDPRPGDHANTPEPGA